MNRTFRIYLALCCAISSILLTGCPGKSVLKTNVVTGTVTYKDAPLAGANVSFTPEGPGNAAYGMTDAEGKYKLQTLLGAPDAGTTPGKYIVTVMKTENVPTGVVTKSPEGKEYAETKPKSLIPVIYGGVKSTPLRATVKEGPNSLDFKLEGEVK